jgi:hypothetical protein
MLRCVSFVFIFTLFLVFFLLRPEKCGSHYLVLTFAQGQLPWKETLDVTLPHSGTVWFTFKFFPRAGRGVCHFTSEKCVLRAAVNHCSPQLRPPSMMRRMISKGKCRFMQQA